MMFQVGQQQPGALPQWAAQHGTCSLQSRGAAGAFIELEVDSSPAAVQAAQQAVQGGWQVGPYKVPARWGTSLQPAGTVQLTLTQPPLPFARQGYTATLLLAAGYEDFDVVAEFRGHSSLVGDAAVAGSPVDAIVAWVVPPPGDELLVHLPEAFNVPGRGQARVYVQGRTFGRPWLWEQEQQTYTSFSTMMRQRVAPPRHPASLGQQQRQQEQQQEQDLPPRQERQQQQPRGRAGQQQQGQQQQQRQRRQAQPQPQPPPPPPPQPPAPPTTSLDVEMEEADAAGQHLALPQDLYMAPAAPLAEESGPAQAPPALPPPGRPRKLTFKAWSESSWAADIRTTANTLAYDEGERQLNQEDLQRLLKQYWQDNRGLIVNMWGSGQPPDSQVLQWLRAQLQLEDKGYGSDGEEDQEPPDPAAAAAAGTAPGPTEVQTPAQPPPRRNPARSRGIRPGFLWAPAGADPSPRPASATSTSSRGRRRSRPLSQ